LSLRNKLFLALLMLGLASCTFRPPVFNRVVEDFVFNTLAYSPLLSAASGYHMHRGVPLDEMLDDVNPRLIIRERGFNHKFDDALAADWKRENLTPADRIDHDLIRRLVQRRLFALEQDKVWQRDAVFYTRTAARALQIPLTVAYDSKDLRGYHLVKRLEKFPQLFGAALRETPAVSPESATRARQDLAVLTATIRTTLPAWMPTQLNGAFQRAAEKALRSMSEYDTHLAGNATASWRLNPELWRKLLAAHYGAGFSAEAVQAEAAALLHEKTRGPLQLPARDATPSLIAEAQPLTPLDVAAGSAPGLEPAPVMKTILGPKLFLPKTPLPSQAEAALFQASSGLAGLGELFRAAAAIEPRGRKVVRTAFADAITVAGWALWSPEPNGIAEQLAYDQLLRRAALGAVLDLGLHGGSLTEPAALRLLKEQAWLPPADQEHLLLDVKLRPGHLAAAFVGWRGLLQLQRDLNLNRMQFRKAVFSVGPLPLDLLRASLSANAAGKSSK
jgi:hypothetical protein